MDKQYTAPSIEFLGSLHELTQSNGGNDGCKVSPGGPGHGTAKTFTKTDGHGMAETGCLS